MNRQIRLVGLGIIVLFVALFVQLNWLQVVHARALNANPLNGRRGGQGVHGQAGRHRLRRWRHPRHLHPDQ